MSFFMSEKDLTEAQRESKEPVGTKGLYRMYKWQCLICNIYGKKMPLSEAMITAKQHCIEYKHLQDFNNPPVRVIGGVFPKGDLYSY